MIYIGKYIYLATFMFILPLVKGVFDLQFIKEPPHKFIFKIHYNTCQWCVRSAF